MKFRYITCSLLAALPMAATILKAEENPAPGIEEPQVPDLIVKDSIVHQVGGRTLTILLGDASTQPDPLPAEPQPLTPEQIAEIATLQAESSQRRYITIGATVYNHSETCFQWKDQTSGKSYEAWSNVDFNHLTQLPAADNEAIPFLKFLSVSNVDTVDLSQKLQQAVTVPTHPALPGDGPGFVIVSGDAADSPAIAGIHAIHSFYRGNQVRLAAAYAERESQRVANAANAAAASVPQDNVMWFRPRKGSRYLQPQPQQEGGAGQ